MTFKQRVCGFKGHEFALESQKTVGGRRTTHVRTVCIKCGYETGWLPLRGAAVHKEEEAYPMP